MARSATCSRFRAADGQQVTLNNGEHIQASTVIWAAGVKANSLSRGLGLQVSDHGRIVVDSLPRQGSGGGPGTRRCRRRIAPGPRTTRPVPAPDRRAAGVAALAGRAHRVPHRLPQPPPGPHRLGMKLLHLPRRRRDPGGTTPAHDTPGHSHRSHARPPRCQPRAASVAGPELTPATPTHTRSRSSRRTLTRT